MSNSESGDGSVKGTAGEVGPTVLLCILSDVSK